MATRPSDRWISSSVWLQAVPKGGSMVFCHRQNLIVFPWTPLTFLMKFLAGLRGGSHAKSSWQGPNTAWYSLTISMPILSTFFSRKIWCACELNVNQVCTNSIALTPRASVGVPSTTKILLIWSKWSSRRPSMPRLATETIIPEIVPPLKVLSGKDRFSANQLAKDATGKGYGHKSDAFSCLCSFLFQAKPLTQDNLVFWSLYLWEPFWFPAGEPYWPHVDGFGVLRCQEHYLPAA